LHRPKGVRRSLKQAGFSLIELMVVVTIIAIVSALVLPSMSQVMRERRVKQAAVSVLDVVRETRSRAMFRGRAQTLIIQSSGSALRFEAYEGTLSSCRLSAFGPGGILDPNARVVTLDLGSSYYSRDNINARISLPSSATYLQICYTPMGTALFSTSPITNPSNTWSNDPNFVGTSGTFQVDVFQQVAGVTNGVPRRILIPLGGIPRMRQ
jgi:prepilin-type N-terminal cleavage/methylation domain-containing protein